MLFSQIALAVGGMTLWASVTAITNPTKLPLPEANSLATASAGLEVGIKSYNIIACYKLTALPLIKGYQLTGSPLRPPYRLRHQGQDQTPCRFYSTVIPSIAKLK
jgi:hypothetical protein